MKDSDALVAMVVSTKPEGSLLPGMINLAITPAINPMTIVQMIPIACSSKARRRPSYVTTIHPPKVVPGT